VAKGRIATWSCDTATNGFTPIASYVLGLSNEQLTEEQLSQSGTWQWKHTNVYAAGTQIATYDVAPTGSPALHFQLEDWLGSRRVQTNINGTTEETYFNLPFGDGLTTTVPTGAPATADDATEHHFTGKERDQESGNDYFKYRYLASSMGRWLSPDPSGLSRVDLGNPQELNLYSYVGNRPLTFTDPEGLCWKGFQWACNIIQKVDNRIHGYGFQTDDQILRQPNERSQKKNQSEREKSYRKETQQPFQPYKPMDLTIDPNIPMPPPPPRLIVRAPEAPKPRVKPGWVECLLAPDASREIANVANQSNSSSSDDDTGGGGGTGGAYLNMRNNGLKPTRDMIGPMGSAEGAAKFNGTAVAADYVVSGLGCATYQWVQNEK
jgi:RHS repeat-associated protein